MREGHCGLVFMLSKGSRVFEIHMYQLRRDTYAAKAVDSYFAWWLG